MLSDANGPIRKVGIDLESVPVPTSRRGWVRTDAAAGLPPTQVLHALLDIPPVDSSLVAEKA